GQVRIEGIHFGTRYQLCSTEPFREQESASFCSGFLVGPDTVVTAGHCVTDEMDCEATRFVFDYSIRQAGVLPRTVSATDVYGCGSVVRTELDYDGADF